MVGEEEGALRVGFRLSRNALVEITVRVVLTGITAEGKC